MKRGGESEIRPIAGSGVLATDSMIQTKKEKRIRRETT